jgi:hypothetical protein
MQQQFRTAARSNSSIATLTALLLSLALTATALWSTPSLAQGSTGSGNAATASTDSGAINQTITFRQPRVTGKARTALKKYASQIAPSKKNAYQLDHVTVDVFINPNADEFTQTAAANMSNEVARRLVSWGVPKSKISRSTEGQERASTKAGTYDVELKATGKKG